MNESVCLQNRINKILVCPKCHGALEARADDVRCLSCFNVYKVEQDIIYFIDKNQLSKFELDESDFHSQIADQADQAHGQETLRSAQLHNDFLFPIFSLPNNSIILDVACGTGVDLIHVAKKGFCIAGVDIAPGMIKIAKDKARESELLDQIKLYISSAYELPFQDSVFDGSYISAALHHMENPLHVIREIARVTKFGGVISIGSEPNSWIYKFRSIKHSKLGRKIMSLFRKDYTIGDQPPGDRLTLGWSYKDWGWLANQCGLELLKITPIWYVNGVASLLGLHSLHPTVEKLFCKVDEIIEKVPGLRSFSFKWNVVLRKA